MALHCDREYQYSRCNASVIVQGAGTVDQARQVAALYGWHHSGAGDRCPSCAGSPEARRWIIAVQRGKGDLVTDPT